MVRLEGSGALKKSLASIIYATINTTNNKQLSILYVNSSSNAIHIVTNCCTGISPWPLLQSTSLHPCIPHFLTTISLHLSNFTSLYSFMISIKHAMSCGAPEAHELWDSTNLLAVELYTISWAVGLGVCMYVGFKATTNNSLP
jgi:hypothetical protein